MNVYATKPPLVKTANHKYSKNSLSLISGSKGAQAFALSKSDLPSKGLGIREFDFLF
ncbi:MULTISPECIES: hypothetical protein [Acinetobacter]|uniref:Uncharacterized protein n=1 Tax=Acinetobacter indicus TaxID=756892 RepID=A0A7S6VT92_9GAMM|nr:MULTISPECIES: hypothetical protein [Acinetobacter]MCJ0928406.1 hypothetical protein [Acinetobacter lwoffii]MDM1772299.1 hypothetical protein [Acinetobacter indicus]MDM1775165.1 hypothetical protein [Acinetobacter indicus]QOW44355.1 hypothetical protein G0027_16195 [Acinetobacter indicus]QSG85702.1 hypothetical protein JYB86_06330 [Acinetobacter indicus]